MDTRLYRTQTGRGIYPRKVPRINVIAPLAPESTTTPLGRGGIVCGMMSPDPVEMALSQTLMSHGHLAKRVSVEEDKAVIDIPRAGGQGEFRYNRLTPFRFEGVDYRLTHEETQETTSDDGVPITRYTFSFTAN